MGTNFTPTSNSTGGNFKLLTNLYRALWRKLSVLLGESCVSQKRERQQGKPLSLKKKSLREGDKLASFEG